MLRVKFGGDGTMGAGRYIRYAMISPLKHLFSVEPLLRAPINAVPECPMGRPGGQETYPYLFRVILFQQLATCGAQAIFERVKNYFGGEIPAPEVVLDTAKKVLRKQGVGFMKASYLKSLAEHDLMGELPTYSELLTFSNQEARDILCQVKGIGRWSADMLLMFNLGREDIMPTLDYALQRGYSLLAGCPHPMPKELEKKTLHWAPYRSYGAWYLWHRADQSGQSQGVW